MLRDIHQLVSRRREEEAAVKGTLRDGLHRVFRQKRGRFEAEFFRERSFLVLLAPSLSRVPANEAPWHKGLEREAHLGPFLRLLRGKAKSYL